MTAFPLVVHEGVDLPTIDSTLGVFKEITREDALQAVQRIARQESEDWFRIGMVLSSYRANRSDSEWADLLTYAGEHFQVNKRKAYYLIDIYERLSSSNITMDQVHSVGWTKLKEIAHLITQDNVDHWVKVANENSTKSLLALLKSKATADASVSNLLDEHLTETPAVTLVAPVVMGMDFGVGDFTVKGHVTVNDEGIQTLHDVVVEIPQQGNHVTWPEVTWVPGSEALSTQPTQEITFTKPDPVTGDIHFVSTAKVDSDAAVASAMQVLKNYSAEAVVKAVHSLFPHVKISSTLQKVTE